MKILSGIKGYWNSLAFHIAGESEGKYKGHIAPQITRRGEEIILLVNIKRYASSYINCDAWIIGYVSFVVL